MITVFGKIWSFMMDFFRLQSWHTGLRMQADAAIITSPVALGDTMSAQKDNSYDVKKTTYSKQISLNAKIFFYLQPQLTFIRVGLNDRNSNLTIKRLWCRKKIVVRISIIVSRGLIWI